MKIVNLVVLVLFLCVLGLVSLYGEAAEQQNKMKVCNEQAKAKG